MLRTLLLEDVQARERELMQQIARLERMEMIGRLAGGVAHDFNNLLTIIIGYGELATELVGGVTGAKRAVDEMLRAARRGADLTRQLLALGRAGRTSPGPVNVAATARGLEKLLRRLLPEDVRLDLQADVDAWAVADVTELEQVIVNLCANARDAMPRGGDLQIVVAVREDLVHLDIADTGTGMDADTLLHAFDPFFTTKQEGRGTGLGLATVQTIVTRLGGTIDLSSELGWGTVVQVALPLCEPPATAASPQDASAPAPGHERLLIVEDDRTVRRLLEVTMMRHGYQVLQTDCAAEALRIVEAQDRPIDVAVMDVVLPGMSGPALYTRLAQRSPGLRVVYMSAHATHEALAEVEASGAPFLAKPFSPAQAARAVRTALEG